MAASSSDKVGMISRCQVTRGWRGGDGMFQTQAPSKPINKRLSAIDAGSQPSLDL